MNPHVTKRLRKQSARSAYKSILTIMRCFAVVLLVLALELLVLSPCTHVVATSSHNLYPKCASEEVAAQASSEKTVELQKLLNGASATELILACVAFDVVPVSSEASCAVPHQTDYAYRLFVEASFVDGSTGSSRTMEYDLRDVSGGSVNRIHITLPSAATYKLKLANTNRASSGCVLKIRAMIEAEAGSNVAESASPVPALIGVRPSVLYASSSSYAYFVFRHVVSALGSADDRVVLIESTRQCSSIVTTDGTLALQFVGSQDASFTRNTAGFEEPSTLSVREFYFDTPGTFRMCYRQATRSQWMESAMVSVYGGNPSYYTFEKGQGPHGEIYVGREVTVRFHGFGLDTRPGGDQAKFVQEKDRCEDGAAAGGVRVATDLGPADDWGPNTRFTEWKWTLMEAGSFKICYKRKDHPWSEVPSLDDLGPGAIQQTLAPSAPIPTPTDPIKHNDCPLAPNGDESTVSYPTLLRVQLTSTTVPSSYIALLQRVLCLPSGVVSISRQSKSPSDGTVILWLSIECGASTSETANSKKACSSQERKNYAIHLVESNSPALQQLQWSTAKLTSQDDLFAVVDGEGGLVGLLSNKHSRRAFYAGCATLITIVGLAVYGVLKYREKQHYFVQFGLDDEDVENEDGRGDLTVDEHGAISKRNRAAPIDGATIDFEVETDD